MKQRPSLFWLLFLFLSLAACQPVDVAPSITPAQATATPIPTPVPPLELTVCLGQEPVSLYPVNNPSASAQSVLAMIYDGPIDTPEHTYVPVILERLPSLENGDVQIGRVAVYTGDEVVDAEGTPVTLKKGIRIRPAGCRQPECAIEYDGKSEIEMDQLIVTFRLKSGVRWSDGKPLTADDSVYAYEVATASGLSYLADRTQAYEAADDLTVQWWGRPGFLLSDFIQTFFSPLPRHAWGTIPPDQLPDAVTSSLRPIGWGPYQIAEWEQGHHILLVKNPYYFRAAEGLPLADKIIVRFVPDPQQAVTELLSGGCDILDSTILLDEQVAQLQTLAAEGKVQFLTAVIPVMEQLAFGIRPASYDNGYNPQFDRPDFLSDVRVRQAIALCIDRQAILETVLYGLGEVPDSYVPAAHPLHAEGVPAYPYDVAAAQALLQQAGWVDSDGDPATPRRALGVPGISNGTPLRLTYLTTQAAQRIQVAQRIVESLAQCGIEVEVKHLPPEEFYAAGPAGPLFGRSFDLAAFAMGIRGVQPSCEWYTSTEIPRPENRWIGTNVSGYSNPSFDAACAIARQSLLGEAQHLAAFRRAQEIFASDLPVLPLYWRVRLAAARPEVCGFRLTPTMPTGLSNIEEIALGERCKP